MSCWRWPAKIKFQKERIETFILIYKKNKYIIRNEEQTKANRSKEKKNMTIHNDGE